MAVGNVVIKLERTIRVAKETLQCFVLFIFNIYMSGKDVSVGFSFIPTLYFKQNFFLKASQFIDSITFRLKM